MRHLSLTRTLITAFVCLGALPAAVLGWRLISTTHTLSSALSTAREEAQSRGLGRSLHAAALSLTDRLDQNLLERYGDAQACGVNTALLYRRAWYRVGEKRNRIVRAANRYVKLYGVYSLAMMVDMNGRVIAVNDRDADGKAIDTAFLYGKQFSGASWFQDVKANKFTGNSASGTVVQDVYVDEDVKKICGGDGRTIGFSAPVMDGKGRVIGVWNNRAKFSLIDTMVASAARDLKAEGVDGVNLTLVDRSGRVLADLDATPGSDGVSLTLQSAQQLRTGQSGTLREQDPRRGVWLTTGYAASRGAHGFPGLGWGVLASVPDIAPNTDTAADATDDARATGDASATGDAARARSEVFAVLTSSVMLLGLAAWWLGRSISRPVTGGIARLKQHATHVSAVSMQVAEASNSLAMGASGQAATIEESSASMEEMSSMTRQNATHAEEAASLMSNARQLVDGANVALGGMVDSMSAIQQATTGISKIIKTIDELAFQSNLLALNAAIEAARAGAAGAGFGVVADEVRSLAQRSAQAAKDTSTLIEASVARAGEGSRRVDEVVQAMAAITTRLERLHGLLQQVKDASGRQTEDIDQVSQALTGMSQSTQSNAAAAEESAATSQELTEVAHSALAVIAQLERLINGATPSASASNSVSGAQPKQPRGTRPSAKGTRRHPQAGPRPVRPTDGRRTTRAA
jgi:methyl-accepting chemotaxis protein